MHLVLGLEKVAKSMIYFLGVQKSFCVFAERMEGVKIASKHFLLSLPT